MHHFFFLLTYDQTEYEYAFESGMPVTFETGEEITIAGIAYRVEQSHKRICNPKTWITGVRVQLRNTPATLSPDTLTKMGWRLA